MAKRKTKKKATKKKATKRASSNKRKRQKDAIASTPAIERRGRAILKLLLPLLRRGCKQLGMEPSRPNMKKLVSRLLDS